MIDREITLKMNQSDRNNKDKNGINCLGLYPIKHDFNEAAYWGQRNCHLQRK